MTNQKQLFVLLALAGIAWLIYLLAPILTPFMVAAILAYIFDPVVDRFEARNLPRILGVVAVFLVMTLIFLGVVLILAPFLEARLTSFAHKLPGYVDTLETTVLPWLHDKFGVPVASLDINAVKKVIAENWHDVGGWLGRIVKAVSTSGATLALWAANLALVPVVTFYLLRDWDDIVERIYHMIPKRYQATSAKLGNEVNDVLSSFLRGQLTVMVALAVIYSTGLALVGLDLALPIGLLAGMVSFVPYLGFIVGIVAATLAGALEFQALVPILWIWAVFAVGQMMEGMVLTPLLVGDKIGLHPVGVIFAVMAGGQLFGFFGVLLGLPVAAAINVLLVHMAAGYQQSKYYHT